MLRTHAGTVIAAMQNMKGRRDVAARKLPAEPMRLDLFSKALHYPVAAKITRAGPQPAAANVMRHMTFE